MVKCLLTVTNFDFASSNPGVRPNDSYRIDFSISYFSDIADTNTSWQEATAGLHSWHVLVGLDWQYGRIIEAIKGSAAARILSLDSFVVDPQDMTIFGFSWQ